MTEYSKLSNTRTCLLYMYIHVQHERGLKKLLETAHQVSSIIEGSLLRMAVYYMAQIFMTTQPSDSMNLHIMLKRCCSALPSTHHCCSINFIRAPPTSRRHVHLPVLPPIRSGVRSTTVMWKSLCQQNRQMCQQPAKEARKKFKEHRCKLG